MNARYRVVQTLSPMQNLDGGFGGGHGQMSHCATSYAAILSLAMVGGKESLDMIDRRALQVTPSFTNMIPGADSLFVKVEMAGRSQATRWWLCGLRGGGRRRAVC